MPLDFEIGLADNSPEPTWQFPFDLTGSIFELTITTFDLLDTASITTVYRSDGVTDGSLVVDLIDRQVMWPVSTAISAQLPLGRLTSYQLRRIVPGGEHRYYADGRICVRLGAARPNPTMIVVTGPQGIPGVPGSEVTDDEITTIIEGLFSVVAPGLDLSAPGNFWNHAGYNTYVEPPLVAALDLSQGTPFFF